MALYLWSAALFAASVSCTPTGPPASSPSGYGQAVTDTVNLGYSTYQGTNLEPAGVLQWLGIRFAAPPLGDLRWRAPQDPVQNDTLQYAIEFQPTCLGYTTQLGPTITEDCLFLDVFAPANANTDSKLPVWFFIQGGGYAADTDDNFNGTEVVMQSNNSMIFVQINYRVGAFGFLASETVREDGDLNVGLLDQRKALEWVQQYIYLFGGDPDHVVIHGDSAGGGSIAFQLTAYNGTDDGLFVGAIAESPFWPTHRTVPEMEFQFDTFVQSLNCADPPNSDIMACLRCLDTATLQSADVDLAFPNASAPGLWYFLPVIDGNFSTDYLYNLYDSGRVVPVPLIVGDDTDEGTDFATNASTEEDFLAFMQDNYPNLSAADLQQISQSYPEDGFGTFVDHNAYFPAAAAAYGESTFICPGITMTASLSQYHSANTTWNYRYNVQDTAYTSIGLGVPHVTEKPAIFGPGNAGACDGCSYLSYNAPMVPIVMDYWISFILTLDPNTYKSSTAPEWTPWQNGDAVQRIKFELDATIMEDVPEAQLTRCALWKTLATISEQ